MQITKNYIEANKERFLEELFGLIRIPSISSESAHKPDMIRCAECWREHLLKAGADKTEVMPTEGNPIVYGEKIIDPKLPTVLVYGHYDVMPASTCGTPTRLSPSSRTARSGPVAPTTTKASRSCMPRPSRPW